MLSKKPVTVNLTRYNYLLDCIVVHINFDLAWYNKLCVSHALNINNIILHRYNNILNFVYNDFIFKTHIKHSLKVISKAV